MFYPSVTRFVFAVSIAYVALVAAVYAVVRAVAKAVALS